MKSKKRRQIEHRIKKAFGIKPWICESCKRNDVAKELPDKCIIALDKLIDEYNKEELNNEK